MTNTSRLIESVFSSIFNDYESAKSDSRVRGLVEQSFKELVDIFRNLPPLAKRPHIQVKFSIGKGSMANVPWIAFLDERITKTLQEGVYCVLLVRSDMAGVYMTFNQGVGGAPGRGIDKGNLIKIGENARKLREEYSQLWVAGFNVNDKIDLADSGYRGKAYEKSTIAYKLYQQNEFPSDLEIAADLEELLIAYDDYAAKTLQIPITRVVRDESVRAYSAYSIDSFISETGFDRNHIEGWKTLLERKKQIIFQGPPGTGKTFIAERLARLVTSGTEGFVETVQFHPAYSYEDFIQGYFPASTHGVLTFEPKPGRFLEFCERARKVPNAPCVFIIDELNRANIPRVFGELMLLLEYRDKSVPLATGGELSVPGNVYILGTMNTADRSIALVDYALRRRFAFLRIGVEYDILKARLESYGLPADQLVTVLREINAAIDDQNYEIGVSFFIGHEESLMERLPDIWQTEIEPYLEEYFYDQPKENWSAYRWTNLVENKLSSWKKNS